MTPEETLAAYMKAFETLDPVQFVPYYNLPCLFMTPAGVFTVSDTAAATVVASRFVQQARQQDYNRSETAGCPECRMLSANLASLSGVFLRFNSKNQQIMQFGFTYLLRDNGAGWKIAVVSVYEPIVTQQGAAPENLASATASGRLS